MEIIISGRRFDVTDDLKSYAEERLAKLQEEYPKLTSARLLMEGQKSWKIVDAHVQGKNLHLDTVVRTQDMSLSIDEAVQKLERQLKKHVEKMKEHRGVNKELILEKAAEAAAPPLPEDEEIFDDEFEEEFIAGA